MTIRNFNSIYSTYSSEVISADLSNQVTTAKWDNRFDGLTLFNSQVRVAKLLTVDGAAKVGGAVNFGDTLAASGAVAFGSTLDVVGATTLNNTLYGAGAAAFGSTLAASGAVAFGSTLSASGAVAFGSTLSASGAVNFGSTLSVAGDVTFANKIFCGPWCQIDPSPHGPSGAGNLGGVIEILGILRTQNSVICNNEVIGAALSTVGTLTCGNAAVNGVLRGPANFVIDPYAYGDETGTVTVRGNLVSNGTLAASGAVNFGSTLSVASTGSFGALTVSGVTTLDGVLRGPVDFIIDPSAHNDETGTVTIRGNLLVKGLTTTINSTTLDVKDLNLTLAKGSLTKTTSNGAGLTIDLGTGGLAEFIYQDTDDNFSVNKLVRCASGPVDGHDLTNKAYVDARIVAAASTITPNSIGLNLISGFKFKVISNTVLFSSVSNDISTIENNILYIWNNGSTVTISLPVASGEPAESVQVYKGINMFAYSTISGEEGHWSSSA